MIKIFNTDLSDILFTLKNLFCIDYEIIDDDKGIYFFPLLTYRCEIKQDNNNNIKIKIEPSHTTQFLGNLITLKKALEKSVAQMFCAYLTKKVIVKTNDEKIIYTPDEKFQWINKETLTFENENCNIIKEFNNEINYKRVLNTSFYKNMNANTFNLNYKVFSCDVKNDIGGYFLCKK